MPYIPKCKRHDLDPIIEELKEGLDTLNSDTKNNTEGNINYIITKLLMMVYGDSENTNYENINNAIGILECCKLELYRKVAIPYEDKKELINGKVI